MARRVLIVQHAEKLDIPGDPGLSVRGVAQAKAAAAWLHEREHIAAVWSSPLRRAVETAEPIALNWDGPGVESLPDFLAEWRKASLDRDFVPRGGESSRAAGTRFLAALEAVVATVGDATVAVVAHGGVTVDALRNPHGDEALLGEAPELIHDGVPSCAVTALGYACGRWAVEQLPVALGAPIAPPSVATVPLGLLR